MAVSLRGRIVEADTAGTEETTGFNLEDATVVEANSNEPSDLEGTTISLSMPTATSGENWAGKEVAVEGNFEEPPGEGETTRRVFKVERIDEA